MTDDRRNFIAGGSFFIERPQDVQQGDGFRKGLSIKMSTASLYAVILMTLIGMMGLWGAYNLNAELRKSYPSEWEHLGRPTPFSMNSMRQELRWIGFVILRKYKKFQDPRLTMFGDLVFFCGLVDILILISFAFITHRLGPVDLL